MRFAPPRRTRLALAPLLALAACAPEPELALPRLPAAERPTDGLLNGRRVPGEHGITGAGPARLPAAHFGDLPYIPARSAVGDDSVMLRLTASLSDVRLVDDGGEDVEAALADFSTREISFYGAGLLTNTQLFGDPFHPPICDDMEMRAPVLDLPGAEWEAALNLPAYLAFAGEVEALMGELSSECADGLLAAAGDVDAAVDAGDCLPDEEHQFFEEGTACRACVEDRAGDLEGCVEDEQCTEEAPLVSWVLEDGEKAWYQLASGVIMACRPDWLALVYLMAKIPPDGTLPESYDHASWSYFCWPSYDPDSEEVIYSCDSGDAPERGHALGEGVPARTLWMERKGGRVAYESRFYYTPKITFDSGTVLRWSWAYSATIGRISKPVVFDDTDGDGVWEQGEPNFGFLGMSDGWGLNPHESRPGIREATSPGDTLALDWLAVSALKNATTVDGISIYTQNFTRCLAWSTPDLEGRQRCDVMGEPVAGWMNDAWHFGTTLDDGQRYSYALPIMTIGSTGQPDERVPGNIVPKIAGSERLALPEWEDCAWPESFVTDLVPFQDVPDVYDERQSLWGDSYNFLKEDELGLRVVLSTSLRRYYCPEAEEE